MVALRAGAGLVGALRGRGRIWRILLCVIPAHRNTNIQIENRDQLCRYVSYGGEGEGVFLCLILTSRACQVSEGCTEG